MKVCHLTRINDQDGGGCQKSQLIIIDYFLLISYVSVVPGKFDERIEKLKSKSNEK